MLNKRDREIKDKVENAKYNQLYEDLRDCETVELKEAVLKTFYSTKDVVKSSNNNRAKGLVAYMDESTPAKPLRKIPTPHDLMGFEDVNFPFEDKRDFKSFDESIKGSNIKFDPKV
jgi:hypothetical protein